MRRVLIPIAGLVGLVGLLFASLAQAEPAVYEIPSSGVICGGTAAHAEMAVHRAGEVESVEADPARHTVVAQFDDDVTSLAAIVDSLRASGLETGEPKRLR